MPDAGTPPCGLPRALPSHCPGHVSETGRRAERPRLGGSSLPPSHQHSPPPSTRQPPPLWVRREQPRGSPTTRTGGLVPRGCTAAERPACSPAPPSPDVPAWGPQADPLTLGTPQVTEVLWVSLGRRHPMCATTARAWGSWHVSRAGEGPWAAVPGSSMEGSARQAFPHPSGEVLSVVLHQPPARPSQSLASVWDRCFGHLGVWPLVPSLQSWGPDVQLVGGRPAELWGLGCQPMQRLGSERKVRPGPRDRASAWSCPLPQFTHPENGLGVAPSHGASGNQPNPRTSSPPCSLPKSFPLS